MAWVIEILDGGWQPADGKEYATKREANAAAKLIREARPGKELAVIRYNKTNRETYSRIIGYNFGTNAAGFDRIYNGAYWTEDGVKQYEFLYYDKSGNVVEMELTDYKGFREIIDAYDYPKK